MHSSVKMVHGNITPENIILNKSGAWKITGFDFCIQSTNPSEQEVLDPSLYFYLLVRFIFRSLSETSFLSLHFNTFM